MQFYCQLSFIKDKTTKQTSIYNNLQSRGLFFEREKEKLTSPFPASKYREGVYNDKIAGYIYTLAKSRKETGPRTADPKPKKTLIGTQITDHCFFTQRSQN